MNVAPIRLLRLLWYFSLTMAVIGAPSMALAAPPASCAVHRSMIARLICRDPELARANRDLYSLYYQRMTIGDRLTQRYEQSEWLKRRYLVCAHKSQVELKPCVAEFIQNRISQLKEELPHAVVERGTGTVPPQSMSSQSVQSLSDVNRVRCGGLADAIDRAICSDTVVGHWDEQMAKLYQQALNDKDLHESVIENQKKWINERNSSCGSIGADELANCLLKMTKRRIEILFQLVNASHDDQDRRATIESILSGRTTAALDADAIDREFSRADQSELALEDARKCIRKNANLSGQSQEPETSARLIYDTCFSDFSKRMSGLDLGALATPSFEMLIRREFDGSSR